MVNMGHGAGQRVERIDARSKVDGSARYVDDMAIPGLLHAAPVRSPHAHARIRSLDGSAALALEGVVAVLGPDDIPGSNLIPLVIPDQTLIATRARFIGDPVALVVAEDPELARVAAARVVVDYEPLPAVFEVLEALEAEVPLVDPEVLAPLPDAEGNVYSLQTSETGDVDRGFAEAAHVVEETYRTPYQEHAYLETQGMTAVPGPDGRMTVYGSMQCPFYVHEAVARVLGLSSAAVRVVQVATGGGFGGKEEVPSIIAGLAAVGAAVTGRPVRLVLRRDEDMEMMSKRHPALIRSRSACDAEGRLTAMEIEVYLDSGAYATLSPVVLYRSIVHASGPYRCPNVRVRGYAVATNKVPCGAFRGFGTLQVIFAHESQLDALADRVGLDPVEIRRRNLLVLGDETSFGQRLDESVGLTETLDRAVESSGWGAKRASYASGGGSRGSRRRGIGVSCHGYGVGLGAKGKFLDRTSASVQLHADGSALIALGNAEIGQGLRTVMAQICAEALGLDVTRIQVLGGDTSRVPDSGPTVASRATVMAGNAVLDACRVLRPSLLGAAADELGCATSELDIVGREVVRGGAPEARMSVDDAIAAAARSRSVMLACGFRLPASTSWDDQKGQGKAYEVYTWSTNVCEVEVDVETGEVFVLALSAAHDIGRAINPTLAEGQIEGGALQGLGFALVEEHIVEQGRILNGRFATYILPTAMDTPEIRPIIVEHPYSHGPFGAKGLGEPPIMGVAPAVIGAIEQAIGVRLTELPATPERIRVALRARENKPSSAASGAGIYEGAGS